MPRIKYMGSADVRTIEVGENFGGRLATPLSQSVRWDISNGWVVDTDQVGLSAEAVSLLAAEVGFLDVTGKELIPVNDNQKIFHAMSDPEPAVAAELPAPSADEVTEEVVADAARSRGGRA